MLEAKYTKEVLNNFAKYVIKQSRSNLTKGKKNVNGKLYKSLDYDLKVMPNSFSMGFLMEEYGVYQDKGVSGIKKKYNTPHKYTTKQPPIKPILDWVRARRIRFRDEQGRFTKGNYKSIAFVIARSIKEKGIKPSLFFTKPFERAFKNLPDDVVEAFGLDVENFLNFTTNDIS